MSVLGPFFDRLRTARSVGILGVLNVTPDSFSDGGRYLDPRSAEHRVDELLDEGADMLDIGGESTRPGAEPVLADVQIARIGPALEYAVGRRKARVSVDTTDPDVARFALARGAVAINDVSCLARAKLARVVARGGGALILMHSRGPMRQMPGYSEVPLERSYQDVVADVRSEWEQARERAVDAGMHPDDVLFDPGLGFMKTAEHSLALVRGLEAFSAIAPAMVVGPSRKSFLAKTVARALGVPEPSPQERLGGTIATCLACADRGALLLRVHDVFAVRQALCMHRALRRDDA